MKFNPGDPVWVKVLRPYSSRGYDSSWFRKGEHPAVIIKAVPDYQGLLDEPGMAYKMDVLDIPYYWNPCMSREPNIRPRRDDYQQKEGMGSMDTIRSIMQSSRAVALSKLA